jgi:hypothetical protein
MMATRAAVPMGMRRVFQRFERWRKSHTGRLPIPEHLWASAAELAREHGVFPTAKVLRLDYGKLKRMAESAGPMECSATAPTSFVELVAPLGDRTVGMPYRVGRATRQDAHPVERGHGA